MIQNLILTQQNNSIAFEILNFIKSLEIEPNNQYDIYNLDNNFQIFRNQMSNLLTNFSENGEILPIYLFNDIFLKLNEEFKQCSNFKSNDIISIPVLKNMNNQKILQCIDNFKKNSPNIDLFNFGVIEFLRCSKCNQIIDANLFWSYDFEIHFFSAEDISSLIKNYFNPIQIQNNDECNNCKAITNKIKSYQLIKNPKFFIISFYGPEMKPMKLNDKISLMDYSSPGINISPNQQYSLYAFIIINNGEFNAFIKKDDIWYLYDTKVLMKTNYNNFDSFYPYMVIYKRMDA